LPPGSAARPGWVISNGVKPIAHEKAPHPAMTRSGQLNLIFGFAFIVG
jgi:hypothetical protein